MHWPKSLPSFSLFKKKLFFFSLCTTRNPPPLWFPCRCVRLRACRFISDDDRSNIHWENSALGRGKFLLIHRAKIERDIRFSILNKKKNKMSIDDARVELEIIWREEYAANEFIHEIHHWNITQEIKWVIVAATTLILSSFDSLPILSTWEINGSTHENCCCVP
jgi:hypothetical protein